MRVIRPAVVMLLALTVLTGVAYPLVVGGAARVLYPEQARGSILTDDANRVVGSELVGQGFTRPAYFWGRRSAVGYDAKTSMGTNHGPNHPGLADGVTGRLAALREADPGTGGVVPIDLVTASGSGLDPHVSPAAARYQIARVAQARGAAPAAVAALVERHVEGRTLGFLGEPRVNVLRLNLALDRAFPAPPAPPTVLGAPPR